MEKKNDLSLFIKKNIRFIYKVLILEDNIEFNISDTYILKAYDNSLIQIIIDYEIATYELSSMEKIIILGDYNLEECTIKLVLVKEFEDNQEITSINSYLQSTYHFGSKFLDFNNNYIFGFCFGWDEIELISENEFTIMVESYERKEEVKIS